MFGDLAGARISEMVGVVLADLAHAINRRQAAVNQTQTSWLCGDGAYHTNPSAAEFTGGHLSTIISSFITLAKNSLTLLISQTQIITTHLATTRTCYRKNDFTFWANIAELLTDAGYPGGWDPGPALPPGVYKSGYPLSQPNIWYQLRDCVLLLTRFRITIQFTVPTPDPGTVYFRQGVGVATSTPLGMAGNVQGVWGPMLGVGDPPVHPAGATLYPGAWLYTGYFASDMKHVGFFAAGSPYQNLEWWSTQGAVRQGYGRGITTSVVRERLFVLASPELFGGAVVENSVAFILRGDVGGMFIDGNSNAHVLFHDSLGNNWSIPSYTTNLQIPVEFPITLGVPNTYTLVCDTSPFQFQPWLHTTYPSGFGGFLQHARISNLPTSAILDCTITEGD